MKRPIKNWILVGVAGSFLNGCATQRVKESAKVGSTETIVQSCTSAREYVATHRYLNGRSEFQVKPEVADATALRVSGGCTGAGERFIKVVQMLTQAGLGSSEAISLGVEFALKTDADSNAFRTLFKEAFARDGFDLDLRASLQLAKSLTLELSGNSDSIRKDFEKIAKFCLDRSGLDLPRPDCARLAARVARQGERYEGALSQDFFELIQFASDRSGPALTTGEALKLSEEMIQYGPGSADNFYTAFKYAESSRGLKLGRDEALQFAKKVTQNTMQALPPKGKL